MICVVGAAEETEPLGFSPSGGARERELESRFDSLLNKDQLRAWMKQLTAHPHHLGSPYDKENAEFIAARFKSWGYETAIEQFDVLFPTPKFRLVEMLAPEKFKARLAEPALKEDATSRQIDEQLPVYNAFSIDGDVTAELVYVNFGIPKDYEALAERGIDVRGKIVIARYGGSWRGIKPKVAAEHGAIGCLIYSDPHEDGYFQGDTYPGGPFRSDYGAQRGSVVDMPLYPGDPLTPGVGATKDAKRLAIKDAVTLTKIPVLPVSYADALPLLRALHGPVAPETWRGALPFTYHIGPGPATVHLKLAFEWKTVPAYDIVAKMPGAGRPDEWVIRGNHHDAWVSGAEDPVSGTVSLMEEARALGELARGGWRPRRTIVFTVWDGEEPGLIGSTEWVETHADLLRQKAVAYVNTDNNSRGFLRMGGSHTLEKFFNEIARSVMDPEKHVSVAERLRADRIVKGTTEEKREARERADLRLGALGSGSDYTPFLQHLGIASLDLRYEGEGVGGSYHSAYDSFDHFTRFIDPHFDYGIALSQTAGRAVLRLANADVLPFEFTDFTDTLSGYVKEIVKLTDDLREETRERNREINDHTLALTTDPEHVFVVPSPKAEVPHLNFAPLQNALTRLQESTRDCATAMKTTGSGSRLPAATQLTLDDLLMHSERALIQKEGLPRRPWFQHTIYAPGFYTGYGVKTLPGVREAIEERNWNEANEQIVIAGQTIERFAAQIDRVTAALKGSPAAR